MIRPYIAVHENIQRTAPNLLNVSLHSLVIGQAVQEVCCNYSSDYNFSTKNGVDVNKLSVVPKNSDTSLTKYYSVAGVIDGATVDVKKIVWSGEDNIVIHSTSRFKSNIADDDKKNELILAKNDDDDNPTQRLILLGITKNDYVYVYPTTDDDDKYSGTPVKIKVKDVILDSDTDKIHIFLWDDIPNDVTTDDDVYIETGKYFNKANLITPNTEYLYKSEPSTNSEATGIVREYSTSVIEVKDAIDFYLEYRVYYPSDEEPSLDNTIVSLGEYDAPGYTSVLRNNVVREATLFNGFLANRTDLANRIIAVNGNNYSSIVGEATENNKMGIFLKMLSKEVPNFDTKIYIVTKDDSESYIEALSNVETSKSIYSLSLLTDREDVISGLKNVISKASDPLTASFKMGLFNRRMPIVSVLKTLKNPTVTAIDGQEGYYSIEYPEGGFSLIDLKVGDKIIGFKDYELAYENYYKTTDEPYSTQVVASVTDIVTDKKIIVYALNSEVFEDVYNSQDLNLVHFNAKDEVIQLLKKYVSSVKDMHMVQVFPDKEIVDDEILPGYYISSLINVIMSHLPPHQGLSNLSLNSINMLLHSNGYFTDGQLDDIASAGILVLSQETRDLPPFIIRQLTTDTDSLEEMEISKVRCLDYTALEVKKAIDGYVGKRNVTERNLNDIREKISSVLKNINKTTKSDTLGSVVMDYKINNISIPDSEPDAITGDVEITTPTSLNSIRLFVKSKS